MTDSVKSTRLAKVDKRNQVLSIGIAMSCALLGCPLALRSPRGKEAGKPRAAARRD
jgi:hypothetical protein